MTVRLTSDHVCMLLSRLRGSTPLVQCLTNTVVTDFTANVVLAIGAAPAMTAIAGEAARFAPIASGVRINVGIHHEEQRACMREAAAAADDGAGTLWVLDPVVVGVVAVCTAVANQISGTISAPHIR